MPAFVKLTDITCQATLCWVPIVANSYTLFSCYICHNVFILLLIRIESDAYFSSAFRQSCAWLNLNVPVFVWVCLLHIIAWLILAFSNRSNNFQAFGNRKDLEQVCLSRNLIDSFVVESLFTLFYLFMLVILLNDKNRLRILKKYSKALCMVWSQASYLK